MAEQSTFQRLPQECTGQPFEKRKIHKKRSSPNVQCISLNISVLAAVEVSRSSRHELARLVPDTLRPDLNLPVRLGRRPVHRRPLGEPRSHEPFMAPFTPTAVRAVVARCALQPNSIFDRHERETQVTIVCRNSDALQPQRQSRAFFVLPEL